MTTALTEEVWRKTLRRVVDGPVDDTTRTLAQMMLDVIDYCDGPAVGAILDCYGSRLLGYTQAELPL